MSNHVYGWSSISFFSNILHFGSVSSVPFFPVSDNVVILSTIWTWNMGGNLNVHSIGISMKYTRLKHIVIIGFFISKFWNMGLILKNSRYYWLFIITTIIRHILKVCRNIIIIINVFDIVFTFTITIRTIITFFFAAAAIINGRIT